MRMPYSPILYSEWFFILSFSRSFILPYGGGGWDHHELSFDSATDCPFHPIFISIPSTSLQDGSQVPPQTGNHHEPLTFEIHLADPVPTQETKRCELAVHGATARNPTQGSAPNGLLEIYWSAVQMQQKSCAGLIPYITAN